MKPDEQRIAIAEFCGWRCLSDGYWYHDDLDMRKRLGVPSGCIPDYPNDLNAMHEAWKCLPNELRLKFTETLFAIVVRDGGLIGIADASEAIQGLIENATAPQRAEALLRTIGKWKD